MLVGIHHAQTRVMLPWYHFGMTRPHTTNIWGSSTNGIVEYHGDTIFRTQGGVFIFFAGRALWDGVWGIYRIQYSTPCQIMIFVQSGYCQ